MISICRGWSAQSAGGALYLGSSIYRIHGSNEPWTIGKNVSSGCIRMRNADVIDRYERVKVGTKVVVM
jgi:lipoprotein-anchoring transpeptidase ErfK/SrfK